MREIFFPSIGALMTCFLLVPGAQATTVYQYAGNNFETVVDSDPPAGAFTTLMNLSGSFAVNTSLSSLDVIDIGADVLSYSFFDGRNTSTEANSQIDTFQVGVDTSGRINRWFIQIIQPINQNIGDQRWSVFTSNLLVSSSSDQAALEECVSTPSCFLDPFDLATNFGQPGAWSTVPAPAAVWLFGSTLGLLGWIRRTAS